MPRSVIALLCGALVALTLPLPGHCFLAWFAPAPFLYVLMNPLFLSGSKRRGRGKGGAALSGFLFGLGYYGTAAHWIYDTCRFAEVPIAAAFLAWAALAVGMSIGCILFSLAADRSFKAFSSAYWPWVCAILWSGIEFAAGRFTPGLGIYLLEYTQWKYLSWIQAASWAGPHGLGFLIVLWNAAIACGWGDVARRGRLSREAGLNIAAAGIMALGWWGYGELSLAKSVIKEAGRQYPVAILQPNVDQYQKWDEHYVERIRKNFNGLLEEARRGRPSLIVWPESSVPGWLNERENYTWVQGWARRIKTYFVVGAMTRAPGAEYNSAVLMDMAGNIAGYYHKRRLVPFGEFVPWRMIFARFVGILSQMGELTPGGTHQALFRTPQGVLGATICFEAMFPVLNREPAARGASVLINVTNDGWYKETWGPYQHFYANVFRAIENRVSILRAANTGISGVIDPYGHVAARLDLNKRGVLMGTLGPDEFPNRSFYNRHGDWFGWLAFIAASLTVLGSFASRKR